MKGPRVAVGDTVHLNDHGLQNTFGHSMGLAHMKTLEMKITEVGKFSLTSPEETYDVAVDNPDINSFLIDDHCFDIVRKA